MLASIRRRKAMTLSGLTRRLTKMYPSVAVRCCSTDTSESGLFDGSSGFKVLVTSDSSDTQLVENMNTSPFVEGTNEGFFDFYYSS